MANKIFETFMANMVAIQGGTFMMGSPDSGRHEYDATGHEQGRFKILRGGSWLSNAWYCCSANRYIHNLGIRYSTFGLRLAHN